MKIRNAGVFNDELVAIAQIDLNVVANLSGRADQRLKGADVEIPDVDAVPGFETFDRVHAHSLAEQELVIAFVAVEFVAAGAANQEIASRATEKVVIAFTADQGVVALLAEQPVVALFAVDQVVAAAAKDRVVAKAGENDVVTAKTKNRVAMV